MYIGIDLGGTNIAAGLVNGEGKILVKDSIKTHAERSAEEIFADMVKLARSVAEKGGVSEADIKAVGVGSPGAIDVKNGVVVQAYNLPFHMTKARELFQKDWNVPFFIENDANAAAYGEFMAGAAKGCRDAVCVTLGTGVGGGIIIDGKIISGFNGAGGEIGHMGIVHNGRACSCGNNGCWEAYSSATALVNFTKEEMEKDRNSSMWELCGGSLDKVSGRTAFTAAKAGDQAGLAVVDKYRMYLAYGILNIVNMLSPEVICVGGGVSGEGDYLLDPVREYLTAHAFSLEIPQTKVVAAQLGNDAGIIGAALLGVSKK